MENSDIIRKYLQSVLSFSRGLSRLYKHPKASVVLIVYVAWKSTTLSRPTSKYVTSTGTICNSLIGSKKTSAIGQENLPFKQTTTYLGQVILYALSIASPITDLTDVYMAKIVEYWIWIITHNQPDAKRDSHEE